MQQHGYGRQWQQQRLGDGFVIGQLDGCRRQQPEWLRQPRHDGCLGPGRRGDLDDASDDVWHVGNFRNFGNVRNVRDVPDRTVALRFSVA